MIWILLLYVLPFIVCCVLGYYMSKTNGETMKDYLNSVLLCLIPLLNIIAVIAGIFFLIEDWIKNDDKWQDFLNKKL